LKTCPCPFNRFTNIPELSKIWQQVLDVKSAAELNLPRPRLKGGKPQIVSVSASEELKAYTKELAKRSKRSNPDESLRTSIIC
jgi:N12 class adenine-specific DNA methylase